MGRVVLGLTDQQFFDLTPRQFHLLLDQHRERTKHEEWMVGILAATIANFSGHPPKEPLKPTDFMPSARAPEEKPKRINRRKVADRIRDFLTRKICQQNDSLPSAASMK
jgi:hypothetical protein